MGSPRIPGSATSWRERQGEIAIAVLRYVHQHPGCVARDVARDVLGGSGNVRTPQRAKAHSTLRTLEKRGYLLCDATSRSHTWWPAAQHTDVDVLADLLSLVMESPPAAAELAMRPVEDRVHAELWAATVHLEASDNAPSVRYPRPSWIAEPEVSRG